MTPQSNLRGAVLGFLGMGMFACTDITIKFLGAGYNSFQIIFFAGILSLPLTVLYAMAGPADAGLWPRQPRLMALRCGFVLINTVFGTYAFTSLPLAQCYAIFFTMPIFIALLSVPILGEKIDPLRGGAILLGLIGVIIALDPGRATLQWGHGAALIGAFSGACNYVIMRKTGSTERTVVLILYPLMLQTAVAALVLPWVYLPMPIADLGRTAFMSLTTFIGYFLVIAAYRRAPGVVVAPMQYSQIIWAAIMGALLFGERMTGHTILGTLLIIAAGIAIVARQDKAA
jgi:S-adenosylmethionine uptake transporter